MTMIGVQEGASSCLIWCTFLPYMVHVPALHGAYTCLICRESLAYLPTSPAEFVRESLLSSSAIPYWIGG
jgi:hypothetical protein